MLNVRNFFGLLVLLAVVSCGQSESTNNSSTSDTVAVSANTASPEDERAVATAVDSLNKGILDPEKNLLESVASEALSYGHSGGKIQNKTEFVDDLINGPFDFQTLNIENQTISVHGDDAIVRHTINAKATNAGAPVDLSLGNLLVWRKEGGQWKLIARQAFKVPEPAKK
ncbi:MAG: nuclear transport factor 2 family protein [Bacteroidota bacterium]